MRLSHPLRDFLRLPHALGMVPTPPLTLADSTSTLSALAVPSARRATDTLHRLHGQFLAEQRFSTRLAPATLQAYRVSFDLLVSLIPTIGVATLTPVTLTAFFRRLDERRR